MKRCFLVSGILAALTMLSLLLVGCSGNSGTPSPVVPQPAVRGRVIISVKWPTPDTRMIPSSVMRIEVSVTAPDITTPITTTLTPIPNEATSSTEIQVPVGEGRNFVATGFVESVGGMPVVAGSATNITVVAGPLPMQVAIPIIGLNEPGNNNADTASVFGGVAAPWKIVDIIDNQHSTVALHDTVDWFTFPAVMGKGYAMQLHFIEGEGQATIEAFSKDALGNYVPIVGASANGSRILGLSLDPMITFTSPEQVFLKVTGTGKYYYDLTINEMAPVNIVVE